MNERGGLVVGWLIGATTNYPPSNNHGGSGSDNGLLEHDFPLPTGDGPEPGSLRSMGSWPYDERNQNGYMYVPPEHVGPNRPTERKSGRSVHRVAPRPCRGSSVPRSFTLSTSWTKWARPK